jgi:hypothetical protein
MERRLPRCEPPLARLTSASRVVALEGVCTCSNHDGDPAPMEALHAHKGFDRWRRTATCLPLLA